MVGKERSGVWLWELPKEVKFGVQVYDRSKGERIWGGEVGVPETVFKLRKGDEDYKDSHIRAIKFIIEYLLRAEFCCPDVSYEGKQYIVSIESRDIKLFNLEKITLFLILQKAASIMKSSVVFLNFTPVTVGGFLVFALVQ